MPSQLAPVALQNREIVYGVLFAASSKTLLRIGADARHHGAQMGYTAVLHTWGQTLHHHPHRNQLVPYRKATQFMQTFS